MLGPSTPSRTPSASDPQRPGAPSHLAEVWGDVVDRRQLAAAVVIGAVVSLATFLIAARIFAAIVASPDVGRAYAMLVGMLGCVLSGVICARLFPPKRVVLESASDPAWRLAAMQQLASETGDLGQVRDLPPAVATEMKELGLYDLFASYDAATSDTGPLATGKGA